MQHAGDRQADRAAHRAGGGIGRDVGAGDDEELGSQRAATAEHASMAACRTGSSPPTLWAARLASITG